MASHIYIKFDEPTIPGSAVGDHRGEIEVLSWNHGFVQPTSPTRGGTGSGTADQATHQNLTFTKYLDSATNELLKYCWNGNQFGRVTLSCFRSDGATDTRPILYLRVVMQQVVISNYAVSGGPHDVPVESVSLDYGVVRYEYLSPKLAGSTESAVAPVTHNLNTRIVE